MNFFAVMFLSSVILVLTVAVVALSAVVRKNLLDIDALQVCVLHLLTEEREEKNDDSEITDVIRRHVEEALYTIPQRYILNADVDAFKDKDGNPVAWQKYMDKMWMTPQKQANTYNFNIEYNDNPDKEIALADIQALFNKMPTKESEQLADVIKLHGDNLTDKKEKKDD